MDLSKVPEDQRNQAELRIMLRRELQEKFPGKRIIVHLEEDGLKRQGIPVKYGATVINGNPKDKMIFHAFSKEGLIWQADQALLG